jgi:hypothetical protein
MSEGGEPATVAQLAALYLGNILYSLESTAMGLDGEGKREDGAFSRGIARALAEGYGREQREARGQDVPSGEAPPRD